MSPFKVFAGFARPLLFAHRGASAIAPENTMEAFDAARRLGAQILELDVHATADNEVVVLHDADLDRTTDGTGPVAQQRYRDVQRLDAGCRFVTQDGLRPFAGRGLSVPRLVDVLQALPGVGFNIEIKALGAEIAAGVLKALEQAGISREAVVLAAGDQRIMARLQEMRPGCGLGLSAQQARQVLVSALVGKIPSVFHGRALQIPPSYYGLPLCTRRVLKKTADAQIPVHLWTINDPNAVRKWLALGVDGVISDDPGALFEPFAQYRAIASAQAQR